MFTLRFLRQMKGEFPYTSLLSRERSSLLLSKHFVTGHMPRKKSFQALKICRMLEERSKDTFEVQYNNFMIHVQYSYFQS